MATYTPVAYTTAANNTQIDFDVTFTFLRTTDVTVSVIDSSGNVLTAGSDYDAALQALTNGTFKMRVVAAGTLGTTQTPIGASHVVSLKRSTDVSQLATVFQDGATFKAADINALITQLFNKIQEVEQSSGEGIGLTDDLVGFDAENKPLRNLAAPTANNDAVRKVDVDSGIGPAITTVAGIASDVTAVVADQADIGVVSADISGTNTIGTVAASIANVNTVGGSIANVNAVAADQADIGVVATDLSGSDTIGTVAGAIANVNTIAGNDAGGTAHLTNISDLAPQASNIGTLTQTANLTALQNAATNAAAAEAALNAFNRTYLGAYASDPTVDNNGDALTDGDLYFNSTSNNLKFYDAGNSQWITLNNAVQVNSAATLQAVGDVDFAYVGGLTLGANDFIVRDNSNQRWENTNASGVRTLLNVEDGADATDATNVQAAGALMDNELTSLTAVKAIDQGLATTDTPTFAGADFGGNAIKYSNVYSTTGDLPSATTYHGMFAHVHATGKGYFAHAGNWQALQNEITTSTALAAASLTTQETGDSGAVSIDVRKANPRTTVGTHTLLGGATLYYANGSATYDVSALTPGDIVTIYCETGTVTVGQGSGSVVLFKDGEATGVASNATVTIGADALATVTCVSATKAIIAGSDLT